MLAGLGQYCIKFTVASAINTKMWMKCIYLRSVTRDYDHGHWGSGDGKSLLAQDRVSADFFQYGSVLKSFFLKIMTNVLHPLGGYKNYFSSQQNRAIK